MANLVTKMVTNYGDDAVKKINAFIKSYSPSRHADDLAHRVDDIAAHMTRNPVLNKTGSLTCKGTVVARITPEQFEQMANAQLVKTGKGDATRIIDEFTGTTYYLTPSGPMYNLASKYGSISQDFWNKLLRLFN